MLTPSAIMVTRGGSSCSHLFHSLCSTTSSSSLLLAVRFPSSLHNNDDLGDDDKNSNKNGTVLLLAHESNSYNRNNNNSVPSYSTILSRVGPCHPAHHRHPPHLRALSTTSSSPSPSSSFSSLPPDEENAERHRVSTLSPYAREMELRKLDADIARLQTLRGINTGELYTLRGKFKMLSRDYGMGFLAWYWTVWFGTAAVSYAAIELGGVDPILVASKVENFLGWEAMSISGKLDPTLGRIGLVVAMNECLEPLRLPLVVVTTKPVVNFFSRRG